MGSVALGVLREAMRPVLLFKPQVNREAPKKITTVAAALDGSAFSEKILSYAVRAARSLSARLLLLQALPVHRPRALLSHEEESDIVESSYLHRKAAEIQANQGIEAQWEVLHVDCGGRPPASDLGYPGIREPRKDRATIAGGDYRRRNVRKGGMRYAQQGSLYYRSGQGAR